MKEKAAATVTCSSYSVGLKIFLVRMPVKQKPAQQTEQCQLLKVLSSLDRKKSQWYLRPQNKENKQHLICTGAALKKTSERPNLSLKICICFDKKNLKISFYRNTKFCTTWKKCTYYLSHFCYFHLKIWQSFALNSFKLFPNKVLNLTFQIPFSWKNSKVVVRKKPSIFILHLSSFKMKHL